VAKSIKLGQAGRETLPASKHENKPANEGTVIWSELEMFRMTLKSLRMQ
jgi:hypothetical protein